MVERGKLENCPIKTVLVSIPRCETEDLSGSKNATAFTVNIMSVLGELCRSDS